MCFFCYFLFIILNSFLRLIIVRIIFYRKYFLEFFLKVFEGVNIREATKNVLVTLYFHLGNEHYLVISECL